MAISDGDPRVPQSFLLPTLRATEDGAEHGMSDVRDRVASAMKLSGEDLTRKLPSGIQPVFHHRIGWSTVYLTKAGALDRVKRGVFKITDRGRQLLAGDPAKITVKELSVFPDFVSFYRGASRNADAMPGPAAKDASETPEEQLAAAYAVLRDALANDLLEAVKNASPNFFEDLVVELLVAMGYGGSVEDAGRAVGGSGDGGIDGIIKQDRLGLDVVYI